MRTHYNNGDEISLQHNGCDSCSPSVINGVFCHETGCQDAWRDEYRQCKFCGCKFAPEDSLQYCCDDDCFHSYNC